MDLCQDHRGIMGTMEYISTDRVEMHYRIPLAEIVFDFFDQLKSRTKGYASLDYHEDGEQAADLVKVDILIQGDKVDAFSAIVHRDKAYSYGVMMTKKLRELIPRQQFEIPIQAAIGSRIIARENIRALRKDVLAKCYGGAGMDLCQDHRGLMGTMEYISTDRVEMHYRIPLAEIVFDFFDQLKSRTKGYASLDYHEDGEQAADLVKVDILIQGDNVDAFSAIVHRDKAYSYGVMMTKKLRELIPRQQFEIPIQAEIGSRIIARENIRALRKDVLAK